MFLSYIKSTRCFSKWTINNLSLSLNSKAKSLVPPEPIHLDQAPITMKVFAATALFAGLAVAAATTVQVTDLSIRDNDGLQSVSFKVEGTDCSSSDPTTLAGNGANACGDGNPPVYTFSAEKKGGSDYQLWLHKNVDGSV